MSITSGEGRFLSIPSFPPVSDIGVAAAVDPIGPNLSPKHRLRIGTIVSVRRSRWMARYFFHLLNDVDAPDNEGKELPNLEAAREHACRNIRFTAGEIIKERGDLVLSHRIQIEDAERNVLDTIYFRDVLNIQQ